MKTHQYAKRKVGDLVLLLCKLFSKVKERHQLVFCYSYLIAGIKIDNFRKEYLWSVKYLASKKEFDKILKEESSRGVKGLSAKMTSGLPSELSKRLENNKDFAYCCKESKIFPKVFVYMYELLKMKRNEIIRDEELIE